MDLGALYKDQYGDVSVGKIAIGAVALLTATIGMALYHNRDLMAASSETQKAFAEQVRSIAPGMRLESLSAEFSPYMREKARMGNGHDYQLTGDASLAQTTPQQREAVLEMASDARSEAMMLGSLGSAAFGAPLSGLGFNALINNDHVRYVVNGTVCHPAASPCTESYRTAIEVSVPYVVMVRSCTTTYNSKGVPSGQSCTTVPVTNYVTKQTELQRYTGAAAMTEPTANRLASALETDVARAAEAHTRIPERTRSLTARISARPAPRASGPGNQGGQW